MNPPPYQQAIKSSPTGDNILSAPYALPAPSAPPAPYALPYAPPAPSTPPYAPPLSAPSTTRKNNSLIGSLIKIAINAIRNILTEATKSIETVLLNINTTTEEQIESINKYNETLDKQIMDSINNVKTTLQKNLKNNATNRITRKSNGTINSEKKSAAERNTTKNKMIKEIGEFKEELLKTLTQSKTDVDGLIVKIKEKQKTNPSIILTELLDAARTREAYLERKIEWVRKVVKFDSEKRNKTQFNINMEKTVLKTAFKEKAKSEELETSQSAVKGAKKDEVWNFWCPKVNKKQKITIQKIFVVGIEYPSVEAKEKAERYTLNRDRARTIAQNAKAEAEAAVKAAIDIKGNNTKIKNVMADAAHKKRVEEAAKQALIDANKKFAKVSKINEKIVIVYIDISDPKYKWKTQNKNSIKTKNEKSKQSNDFNEAPITSAQPHSMWQYVNSGIINREGYIKIITFAIAGNMADENDVVDNKIIIPDIRVYQWEKELKKEQKEQKKQKKEQEEKEQYEGIKEIDKEVAAKKQQEDKKKEEQELKQKQNQIKITKGEKLATAALN